jgi:hypothetical protein
VVGEGESGSLAWPHLPSKRAPRVYVDRAYRVRHSGAVRRGRVGRWRWTGGWSVEKSKEVSSLSGGPGLGGAAITGVVRGESRGKTTGPAFLAGFCFFLRSSRLGLTDSNIYWVNMLHQSTKDVLYNMKINHALFSVRADLHLWQPYDLAFLYCKYTPHAGPDSTSTCISSLILSAATR